MRIGLAGRGPGGGVLPPLANQTSTPKGGMSEEFPERSRENSVVSYGILIETSGAMSNFENLATPKTKTKKAKHGNAIRCHQSR